MLIAPKTKYRSVGKRFFFCFRCFVHLIHLVRRFIRIRYDMWCGLIIFFFMCVVHFFRFQTKKLIFFLHSFFCMLFLDFWDLFFHNLFYSLNGMMIVSFSFETIDWKYVNYMGVLADFWFISVSFVYCRYDQLRPSLVSLVYAGCISDLQTVTHICNHHQLWPVMRSVTARTKLFQMAIVCFWVSKSTNEKIIVILIVYSYWIELVSQQQQQHFQFVIVAW